MKTITYTVQNNASPIYLGLEISTAYGALITAGVDLFINGKKYPKEKADGNDIQSRFLIGMASELKNGLLVVDFVINLKFVDSDYWDDAFDDLAISYRLTGGMANEEFAHTAEDIKFKSNSGRIIQTDKRFFFKQELP